MSRMSIPELSVLVVDDDADAADIVARWLRLAGHHVRSAADGRQALGEVVGRRFDAVVLDLMMPDMDGPAFLDAIRSCLTAPPRRSGQRTQSPSWWRTPACWRS